MLSSACVYARYLHICSEQKLISLLAMIFINVSVIFLTLPSQKEKGCQNYNQPAIAIENFGKQKICHNIPNAEYRDVLFFYQVFKKLF